MKGISWRVFFRSFLIQGGWNYRNLLGSGFAWALLGHSRRGTPRAEDGEWLDNHTAHFNLHPYLSTAALAAVTKMESEGRSVDEVRRFKGAIGSLFGSLGDGLFWNAWRPVTLVVAAGLALLGVSPIGVVVGFLIMYNALHLWARVHGAVLGLESGIRIGEGIRALRIPLQTERIRSVGVLFLGLISGFLLMAGGELPELEWTLTIIGGLALAVGWSLGEMVHRWIPAVLLILILVGLLPIYG